jgi:excisionase family DNA binding protein
MNTSPLVLRVVDLIPLLSISRNTAYELVRSGKIRSIRIGRGYRIPREAVDEYLAATR